MDEGLPEEAIRNAAAVACRRDASNREARAREQQQQMQPQVGPSSSNDATCTTPLDASLDKQTVVGTINYSSGAVYEGEVKDGKPRGRGKLKLKNGEVYDGEWKEGKRHGNGVFRDANGSIYDGEWKDGKPHGRGTKTNPSGVVYDGEWGEGKAIGKGTIQWPNGDVYKGEFVDGQRQGWGTLEWSNGEVYDGEWRKGKEHGKGTKKLPTGETYEGHWVDGVWQQGMERLEKDSGASEDLAAPLAAPSSRDNTGGVAPNTNDNEQPAKEKRIYIERQLRSQSSQQKRLEKCTAFEQSCECCGVDDDRYKLRVCSGCNLALYCSAACQKAASRSHRRICDIVSQLPSRDTDRLALKYDRDKMVDLDAGLRYGKKYMSNLKHLAINLLGMKGGDTFRLSAKRLSSLLRSKRGGLDSFIWGANEYFAAAAASKNGDEVWKELCGLKQLRLDHMKFEDVQSLRDIIGQQKDTLMALCLPWLGIDWSKAKCRRSVAQAVSSCKHLAKLELQGCVLMDPDLKIMLHNLPNLRVLNLARISANRHEFTDNTCGLIARKCPGLQELCLFRHDQLSVRGIRKIFEGCPHLRSFYTTSHKLSGNDVHSLLAAVPQLLYISLDDEIDLLDVDIDEIIEVTGGRTLLNVFGSDIWMPHDVSAATREKYLAQTAVWERIESRKNDCRVMNEWEDSLSMTKR